MPTTNYKLQTILVKFLPIIGKGQLQTCLAIISMGQIQITLVGIIRGKLQTSLTTKFY